jgi:hypothetical protein
MSQKRSNNVPNLVEKYRREFPTFEKRHIRRIIIVYSNGAFKNPSELKKLTRALKKSFELQPLPYVEPLSEQDVAVLMRLLRDLKAGTVSLTQTEPLENKIRLVVGTHPIDVRTSRFFEAEKLG